MSQAEELLASLIEDVPVHTHTVSDSDTYFIIDPDSREITNASQEPNVIMQFDHESEVFTFELPRFVEGHDMMLCNRVYSHWNNIEATTGNENADLHELTDLHINPDNADTVICTWKPTRHCTQLVGILSFLIQYACVDDDGNVTYEWHTDIYEDVEVRKGRKNTDAAVIEYSDILEQWYARLFGIEDSAVADISQALTDAQQTLQEESETQQSAIEAKGAETLASIPADYTTSYRMSEEAMRTKADAIVLDVEGEYISVTNASDDPLQSLRIFGKTTQFTTTGAQLFDKSAVTDGVLEKDGSISTDASYVTSEYIPVTPSTTYYQTKRDSVRGKYYDADMNRLSDDWEVQTTTEGEFTTPEDAYYFRTSILIDNVDTYMLNLGSTGLDYEPYTGGYASPSPEYPQELESIDPTTVIVRGKNILPETVIEFTRDLYMPLGFTYPAGRYSFSAVVASTDTDDEKSTLLFYKGDEWIDSISLTRSENGERVLHARTVKREFDAVRFYASRSYGTSEGDDCALIDALLEMADESTDYEPYSAYTLDTNYTLNALSDREGNVYRDELVYDYPNDKWQFIQRIAATTLVGTEIFEDYIASGDAVTLALSHMDECPIYCTHGLDGVEVDWANNTRILFRASEFGVSTVSEFADFAASQYENGSPIKLIYVLEEPIVTELTTEEVMAFKALYTNRPNTVIQNGVGANMIAEYNADTEIFMRENQPMPSDEQIQNAVNVYLDTNSVQVPSDDHINALIDAALGELVNGEY